MNELNLLDQLQTIKNKLDNNEKLNENESKLFTAILFSLALSFIKQSINLILSILKGGDKK